MQLIKYFILLKLLLITVVLNAQFDGSKTWYLDESVIIYPTGDSVIFYSYEGDNNIYDLSLISYRFLPDSTYSGTSVNGDPISGVWSVDGEKIHIDDVNAKLTFIAPNKFVISQEFYNIDSLENPTYNLSLLTFTDRQPTPILDKYVSENVRISPNPATNELNIIIENSSSNIFEIQIFTIEGRLLMHELSDRRKEIMGIDISALLPGVYVLSVVNQSTETKLKFIKI